MKYSCTDPFTDKARQLNVNLIPSDELTLLPNKTRVLSTIIKRYNRQRDRYSRQRHRYSRQRDRYSRQRDRYSRQRDRYSRQRHRFSRQRQIQ